MRIIDMGDGWHVSDVPMHGLTREWLERFMGAEVAQELIDELTSLPETAPATTTSATDPA